MRNPKKGATLMEVLVAIAVFAIISVAMFSSLTVMTKTAARQEEYLRFEMICTDIALYGDEYALDWDEKYMADRAMERPLPDENGTYRIYFNRDFEPSATERIYSLTYFYLDTNGDGYTELILTIRHIESERVIIKSLNYGGGRYH